MCNHSELIRVEKNRGIQETHDKNVQMILGNCMKCGSTLVWGWCVNGVEYQGNDREGILSELAIGG